MFRAKGRRLSPRPVSVRPTAYNMPSGIPCVCAARNISRSHVKSWPSAHETLDVKAAASASAADLIVTLSACVGGLLLAPGLPLLAERARIGLREPCARLLLGELRPSVRRARRRRVGGAAQHLNTVRRKTAGLQQPEE